MINVLIASQHFYPENFRINDVAQSLVDSGCLVDVLTGKPNYPNGKIYSGYRWFRFESEIWRKLNIYRIPIFPRRSGGALNLIFNYMSFVFSGLIFGPWMLIGKKYDIVFCYATSPFLQVIPALFIAKIKNAKLVVNVQDIWPDSLVATGYIRNKYLLNVVEKIVIFLYEKSDLLLTQSKEFQTRIEKVAPDANTKYWPNSVDKLFSSDFSDELPNIPAFDNGKFNIVFTGNIGEAQAIDVILEMAIILKECESIQILIYGQGSRWSWLKDRIAENNLNNIFLLGSYPIEMMPAIMRKASALLVTLADQDIFSATIPNKVQAYLASGRPILAAINGEAATVIAHANAGIVVPAGDSKELAHAAIKLFGMSEKDLNFLGKNGRQYFINHFDHDQLVNNLIKIFYQFKE
jgi:glycosyltransferase involved in cell wall biosynthesis